MTNDKLDRSIRAIVGDARPTPEAEAAMNDAFATIAQEAVARSASPSLLAAVARHPRSCRAGLGRPPWPAPCAWAWEAPPTPPTPWGSSACSSPAITRL
ncbi:hypothetical protein [Adlercreutzia equolifaciens]|uniref:hypothetical protein n=1 Tax=Adlercreutzia equolifaciens TaxID=446660 RepID=UPI0019515459|nr:hypothetical protein [Adlercreutzia equolifaciens]